MMERPAALHAGEDAHVNGADPQGEDVPTQDVPVGGRHAAVHEPPPHLLRADDAQTEAWRTDDIPDDVPAEDVSVEGALPDDDVPDDGYDAAAPTEEIAPVRAAPGQTTVRTSMPKPQAPSAAPTRQAPGWAASARAQAWVNSVTVAVTILGAVLLGGLAEAFVIGGLQHGRDQQAAYAQLREDLANGVTAVGPNDVDGNPLPLGAPVALLRMGGPERTEVVLNGTTSGVLARGVGHRRDTPLPGQPGVSVLMGRRATFGGPFATISRMHPGEEMLVTTGLAQDQRFRVLDVRRAGDPLPAPLKDGGSRLTLMTTAGSAFFPDGLVYVDADLIGDAQPGVTPAYTARTLPLVEQPLHGEWRALVPVTAWGLLLVGAALATTYLRLTWGRWQAWSVAVPTLGFLGVAVAGAALRFLPNLL